MIAWLTGPPASGKTTLARRVHALLDRPTVLLDSDEVREAIGANGYAPAERDAFYRALAELALLLERQELIVVIAATGAKCSYRDVVRERANRFIEVYVRASQSEREGRDVKGLYARARAGAAPELPGVGVLYEPPRAPELVADGGLDEVAAWNLVEQIAGVSLPRSGRA